MDLSMALACGEDIVATHTRESGDLASPKATEYIHGSMVIPTKGSSRNV